MIKLSSIKVNPRNPRIAKDERFKRLCESLKEFPKMMVLRPIIIDENRMILGGNLRYKALLHNGMKEVPDTWVKRADELTDDEKRRFILTDNSNFGDWDFDILANEYDINLVIDCGINIPSYDTQEATGGGETGEHESPKEYTTLAERFIIPPFSVLNARAGEWQERKRAWLALGIESLDGRMQNLPTHQPQGIKARSIDGRYTLNNDTYGGGDVFAGHNNSVFDPVLCELMYKWFCVDGGTILDPFAGGSVRGVVANYLGYKYIGIELRKEQIEANEQQAREIIPDRQPQWICGNALDIKGLCNNKYDFIFSCPPYYDLEVYSDDPADLSNYKTYGDFIRDYNHIIADTVSLLTDNRFACFVVGDVRDKKGFYRNFVADTINAFQQAGASLYNEAILVTLIGSLSLAANNIFKYRKLGKTHQNVLIFYKGDPKKIKENYGEIEIMDLEDTDGKK